MGFWNPKLKRLFFIPSDSDKQVQTLLSKSSLLCHFSDFWNLVFKLLHSKRTILDNSYTSVDKIFLKTVHQI